MIDDEIAGVRVSVRAIPRSVDLSIPDRTANGRVLIDGRDLTKLIGLLCRARAELNDPRSGNDDPGVFDFVVEIDRSKEPPLMDVGCRLCGVFTNGVAMVAGLFVCRCGARCPMDENGLKP